MKSLTTLLFLIFNTTLIFSQATFVSNGSVVQNASFPSVDGGVFDLYETTSTGKHVFIYFILEGPANCAPCVNNLAGLEQVFSEYGCNQEDVHFEIISYTNGQGASEFVNTTQTLVPASNGTTSWIGDYLGVPGFPTSIIVSPDNIMLNNDVGLGYDSYNSALQNTQISPSPCTLSGCTDSSALNYDSTALVDNDSCQFPPCESSIYTGTIDTDCWGNEVSIQISDSDNLVVEDIPLLSFPNAEPDGAGSFTNDFCLPDGCYTITITDSYGDGMFGSQYSSCNVDGDYYISDEFGNIVWDLPSPDFGTSFTGQFCVPFAEILGCTDPNATNYNPLANQGDGSCEYPLVGQVTLVTGETIDLDQIIEDGQHIMLVVIAEWDPFTPQFIPDYNEVYTYFGCNYHDLYIITVPLTSISDQNIIDFASSNGLIPPIISYSQGGEGLLTQYNFNAVPSSILIGAGGQIIDTDLYGDIANDIILQTLESYGLQTNPCLVPGCVDSSACNYNSNSEIDDGSCDFNCYGCTDPTALNYDETVSQDDGSCIIIDCANIDLIDWSSESTGIFADYISLELGQSVNVNNVININSVWTNENDGNTYSVSSFEIEEIIGLPAGFMHNLENINASIPNLSQGCFNYSGLAYPQGLYDVSINGSMGVLIGDFEVFLPATFSQQIEIIWDGTEISGCTYPSSQNFNPAATADDGSCVFSGCTLENAINYNEIATQDDGSCLFAEDVCGVGLVWSEELQTCINPEPSCQGDINGDGSVTSGDLTLFLSAFGTECD